MCALTFMVCSKIYGVDIEPLFKFKDNINDGLDGDEQGKEISVNSGRSQINYILNLCS